jgi:hypothetical protein
MSPLFQTSTLIERQCLAGEALRKFNKFAINMGNKTSNNLILVEQRLVRGFITKDV